MKTEVSRSRSRSPVRGRRSDSVPRRRDRGGGIYSLNLRFFS